MTLLGVEVRRALARRAVRVLIAIALVGVAGIGIGVFLSSDADVDVEQVARTEALRATIVQQCIAGDGFEHAPGASPRDIEERCRRFVPPPGSGDDRFHLTDLWQPAARGDAILWVTAVFLAIGAFIGGSTVVGADWRWGTIGTQLTWEPRRGRLFAAKVAAAGLVAVAVAVILQLLLAVAVLPAAVFRGTTAGADVSWALGAAGAGLRAALLAGGAALAGQGAAWIGRNSAAALGAAFAYLVVVESLVRAWKPAWHWWLLADNVAAFLVGTGGNGERPAAVAALALASYLGALLALAAATFRYRDIT